MNKFLFLKIHYFLLSVIIASTSSLENEFLQDAVFKKYLKDLNKWENYFLQESKKAQELKSKIETTDKKINQLVYELYELTEDETKIVEGK